MHMIQLRDKCINPETEIQNFREQLQNTGAIVSFNGTVRNKSSENNVSSLTIQHYPGFTEKYVNNISRQAQKRWQLSGSMILHRYGTIKPGETIVLTVAAAEHRQPAFEACNFLIDHLKTKAPFWKKEHRDSGSKWIEPSQQDQINQALWNTSCTT